LGSLSDNKKSRLAIGRKFIRFLAASCLSTRKKHVEFPQRSALVPAISNSGHNLWHDLPTRLHLQNSGKHPTTTTTDKYTGRVSGPWLCHLGFVGQTSAIAGMAQTDQPVRRQPLVDATHRVNNGKPHHGHSGKDHSSMPHHESLRPEGNLQLRNPLQTSPLAKGDAITNIPDHLGTSGSPNSKGANNRLSAISKEYQNPNSNRNSQISTTSTNASDGRRRKTHIGPWQLGKTLGKGATARVRLARHAATGQLAAIKIVQKKNAQLTQAGSLASLDRNDAKLPDVEDGSRRMPYGIEREVAIMKLIEHPHIMRLYDIWENRTEM
jgi:hypothetical protein